MISKTSPPSNTSTSQPPLMSVPFMALWQWKWMVIEFMAIFFSFSLLIFCLFLCVFPFLFQLDANLHFSISIFMLYLWVCVSVYVNLCLCVYVSVLSFAKDMKVKYEWFFYSLSFLSVFICSLRVLYVYPSLSFNCPNPNFDLNFPMLYFYPLFQVLESWANCHKGMCGICGMFESANHKKKFSTTHRKRFKRIV